MYAKKGASFTLFFATNYKDKMLYSVSSSLAAIATRVFLRPMTCRFRFLGAKLIETGRRSCRPIVIGFIVSACHDDHLRY